MRAVLMLDGGEGDVFVFGAQEQVGKDQEIGAEAGCPAVDPGILLALAAGKGERDAGWRRRAGGGRRAAADRRGGRRGEEIRPVVMDVEAEDHLVPLGIEAREAFGAVTGFVGLAEHLPRRRMLLGFKRELAQHEGIERLGRSAKIVLRAAVAPLAAGVESAPERIDRSRRHVRARSAQGVARGFRQAGRAVR
jgi:hypothetical protein